MINQNVLGTVIIAFGGVATLYVALSWLLARLWCKPRRLLPSRTPAAYGLPFDPVQFPSHGLRISAWFIPAARNLPRPAAIILAHGWGKNAAEMLPLARLLHAAGFALLLYDARGHGASEANGPITILKLAQDVIAGAEYLCARPDVDGERLGVVGRSIGGSAAILAASVEPRIRSVVSCSAFADPKSITRTYLTRVHMPAWLFAWPVFRFIELWLGTTMESVAPWRRIGLIQSPLLLIHGQADRFIGPSDMEQLHAHAARGRTQRLLLPGRGHSDILRDPKCRQGIVAFLATNLRPGGDQSALPAEGSLRPAVADLNSRLEPEIDSIALAAAGGT